MFYNIELASDPKIIGVKNGIYQVILDQKAYDKKVYNELESLFIKNDFTAKQEYPEVNFRFYFKELKSTKKTNFMRFSPFIKHARFLINKDVVNIFKKFNIQRYKLFETVIYDSSGEHQDNSYSLFYSVLLDWEIIDFTKTVFVSGGFGKNPIIEHSFADEVEMKNFKGITNVKILSLSKKFDCSLDFFHTRLGGLFVSERLKLELERNNMTGINFNNGVQILTNEKI